MLAGRRKLSVRWGVVGAESGAAAVRGGVVRRASEGEIC